MIVVTAMGSNTPPRHHGNHGNVIVRKQKVRCIRHKHNVKEKGRQVERETEGLNQRQPSSTRVPPHIQCVLLLTCNVSTPMVYVLLLTLCVGTGCQGTDKGVGSLGGRAIL
jgi:hypothetical protein